MSPSILFYIALAILGCGVGFSLLNRPTYAAFAYLTVLFCFPTVNWGLAQGVDALNLYNRGTGLLYFSIVNVYLFGLFALSLVYGARHSPGLMACNLRKYFVFFLALFLIQAAFGAAQGIAPAAILKQRGTINLVNMGLIAVLLIRLVGTPYAANQLANLILTCGVLRGLFGFARFIFSHGDISNVYQNLQGIGIKLTFFDINDSLLACMSATIATWRLLDRETPKKYRAFYAAILLLEIFICAFSYRRTAWGGMVLAATLFCFLQPLRTRMALLAVGIAAGGAGLTVLIYQRFGHFSNKRGVFDMFFYDVSGSVKEGRFAELNNAFLTVIQHPTFGVGPWGGYGPNGALEYMHSGIMHVWLKSGLVGLIPFLLLFASFWLFCKQRHRAIPRPFQALFWTGATSLLFVAPNILMGTPIIEYRTMQMMGICLALPYIAYGVFANARAPLRASKSGAISSDGFQAARQKLIELERSTRLHA